MARFVHRDRLFRVVGNHAHSDELCHPVGETKDSVSFHLGSDSWLVELINCKHGITECFIPKKNLNEEEWVE